MSIQAALWTCLKHHPTRNCTDEENREVFTSMNQVENWSRYCRKDSQVEFRGETICWISKLPKRVRNEGVLDDCRRKKKTRTQFTTLRHMEDNNGNRKKVRGCWDLTNIISITVFLNSSQVCLPTKPFAENKGMYDWCRINCLKPEPRICPPHMCYCPWVHVV